MSKWKGYTRGEFGDAQAYNYKQDRDKALDLLEEKLSGMRIYPETDAEVKTWFSNASNLLDSLRVNDPDCPVHGKPDRCYGTKCSCGYYEQTTRQKVEAEWDTYCTTDPVRKAMLTLADAVDELRRDR